MSDSVNYIAGDTKGRDHIQWPTATREQMGDPDSAAYPFVGGLTEDQKDQQWPVDVTLAQIMAMCWKVRRWKFSGNCSASLIYTPPSDTAKHISGTAVIGETELVSLTVGGDEITREQQLVGEVIFEDETPYKCLVNGGVGVKPGEEITSDWSTTSDINGNWSGSFQVIFSLIAGFHLFDEGTKKFSPPFNIHHPAGGNMIPADGPGNQLIMDISPFRNPVTVSSGIGPLAMAAPGVLTVRPGVAPDFDVPLQLSWRLQLELSGSTLSGSGSGAFTLEATDFWTYSG